MELDPFQIQQLVRGEVDNFFDNVRETAKQQNEFTLAVLALLPEAERTNFLLSTQSNVLGTIENLVENTFGVINKIVDANIKE